MVLENIPINMSLIILIFFGIIPVIFTILLFIKIIKTGIKISAIFFLIISIVIAGIGLLSYIDVKDIEAHEDFPELWLVVEEGNILTGFEKVKDIEDQPRALTTEEIKKYQSQYSNKNYDGMRKNNYKIYFINPTIFETISNEENLIEDKTFTLTRSRALQIIYSGNPISNYTSMFMEDNNASEDQRGNLESQVLNEIGNDNELRARMVGILMSSLIKKEGQEFFITEVKEGNIIIYPEGLTEKLLQLLPNEAMKKLMKVENGNNE